MGNKYILNLVLHQTKLLNLGTQVAIVGEYFPERKIMFQVQLPALLFTNYASKPHRSSRPGNFFS